MKLALLVALGGALGSLARYKLGGWILHHLIDWKFPAGTFVVNVTGCLAAGILAGLAERHNLLSGEARVLLFTGFLGGFTTFSAFGLETTLLLQRGELAIAAANVLLSVLCGILALWAALKLTMTLGA
jgi:CrcB protein